MKKFFCFFAAIHFASFSSHASDYTNNDLSGSVLDNTAYNNVTIVNNRSLSSGSFVGGYVYLGSTLSGNISFTNNGSITSTNSNYSVLYLPNVGNISAIKSVNITNNASHSLISTGTSAATIYLVAKYDGSFPSIVERSVDYSLNNSGNITSASDAVTMINGDSGTFVINNSGIITAGGTSSALNLFGGASATIANSGTIAAAASGQTAINVNVISATLTNSGSASITGKISATGDSSTALAVTNNSSGGISGDIITTNNADLDVTNISGTITGNIILGNNASSSLTINGGAIIGNVTFGNANQLLTFNGNLTNSLTGNINGAGKILVSTDTVLNGNIGNSTAVSQIEIAANKNIYATTNANSINATNLLLNSASAVTVYASLLNSTVDGVAANQGTVYLEGNLNNAETVSATIGSTNGIAVLEVDGDTYDITLANSVKAAQVNIATPGTDFTLNLAAGKSISGAITIYGDNSFKLNSGSSVAGDITGASVGEGNVLIANNATVSGVGNFGTVNFSLAQLSLGSGSTLTMANTKAINSANIILGANSILNASNYVRGNTILASGSTANFNDGAFVSGAIDGSAAGNGAIATNGLAIVLGEVGSSHSVNSVTINAGSQGRFANISAGPDIINANNIFVAGQFDLLDQTTINGNVSLTSSSAKINTSGYSQTINGDFTTVAGSMIIAGIHTASNADKITVNGLAVLASNTKLYVSFSSGGTTAQGARYVIVDGGTGSSISAISNSNILIDGVATNHYGNLLLTTEVDGSDLILLVSNGVASSISGENKNLYNIINSDNSTSGALYQLKQFVNTSNSEAEVNAALKSATPQVDNANNRIAFNSASSSLDMASRRLESLNNLAFNKQFVVASNNSNLKNLFDASAQKSVWAQTFGSNISQGNTAVSGGYNANLKGLAFGADKKISNDSYLGFSFSYANSDIKSRDTLKHTGINAYQLNAYHGYNFDKFFVNNFIGFVWNNYNSNRAIPVSSVNAKSNYNGQVYVARSELGLNQKLKNDFIFTPSFMITAARSVTGDYSETGAQTLNLNVKSSAANFFEPRVGFTLANQLQIKDHLVLPSFFSSYGYDLAHSNQQTSANFVGQSQTFDSTAARIARGSLKVGFGTKIYSNDDTFLDANYVFEHRQNFAANSVVFKVTKKF